MTESSVISRRASYQHYDTTLPLLRDCKSKFGECDIPSRRAGLMEVYRFELQIDGIEFRTRHQTVPVQNVCGFAVEI